MSDKTSATHDGTVIVFDTNVLLTDPEAILSYPGADIIIPETVLGEIDKLKTARVDPDLRFKGREFSRLLFELGEGQSFVDGVTLPDGGTLRVIPFENSTSALPEGFSTKTSDNKILAVAYLMREELAAEKSDKRLVLVTNDLNMLLKAQTLDIEIAQFGNGTDLTWGKKYIVRPFQRYRIPLTILMIALAVFAAVLVLAIKSDFGRESANAVVTSEFRGLLTTQQRNAYDALVTLKETPNDSTSLLTVANFYDDRATQNQVSGDNASMLTDAKAGIRYYERYLAYAPTDADARSDMATLYYYTGDTDRAIQEVSKVLSSNPDHANANYNLGIFYYFGRRDLTSATDQMNKVIKLTASAAAKNPSGTEHVLNQQAKAMLTQIKKEQSSGGSVQSTEKSSTDLSTGN